MALNFPDSPTLNQVYTDATSGFSYQWDGYVWQSYTPSGTKNILIIDDISASFNGSTQTFALASSGSALTPLNAQQLRVALGGIVQEPVTDYTVSGSNITFTTAPGSGLDCSIVSLGPAIPLSTILDGTVTPAKLSTGGPSWNTSGDVYIAGITTIVNASGKVIAGIGTTALIVEGNARVTGILTVGTSSITLNGVDDRITVGTGLTLTSSGIQAGVITATTLNATTITGAVTGNATGLTGTPDIAVRNITGVAATFTGNISVSGLATAGTGCVTGTLTAATGCVPGTMTAGTGCISGTLTAATGCVPGTITAGTATVPGTMTAGTGCVTGTLTAATGCVPGTITAGNATVPGTVTAGTFSGSGASLTNIPSGAITGGISAAGITTFTSSGTWTKPTTAKFVMAEVIGAGGGGGGGSRSPGGSGCINAGGGGGGAGGYFSRVFPAPSLSPTVSITVGSGGVGGIPVQQPWSPTSPCPASYGHGTNGGNSSFGCYLIVSGGNGGLAPWPGSPTAAGGMGGGIGGRTCPFFSPPVTAEMPNSTGSICCIQSTFRGIFPPTNVCSGVECFGVYAGGSGGSSVECTTTRTLGAGNGVHSFIAGGGGGGGAGKYSPYGSPSTCPVIGGGGGLSNSYCSYQCGGPSIACIKGGDSATHSLNGCPAPSLYPADCMHGGGGGGTGSVGGAGGNASPIAGGGGGAGWNAPESCPGGNGGNGKVVVYSWS